jgi:hypothetical protein
MIKPNCRAWSLSLLGIAGRVARGIILWPTVKKEQQQGWEGSWQNNYCDGVLRQGWGVKQIAYTGCVWYVVVVTTTTCWQLGNDTTYDTEKKNPTSHDVADTSAVSGRRVGKTRSHAVKTNCGRLLKQRHFQLRLRWGQWRWKMRWWWQ